MTGISKGIRRFASGLTAGAALLALSACNQVELLGQPNDRAIDLQHAAAPLRAEAIWFHNVILMPIITAITLLVLGLLIWVSVRYNRRANPTPARWTHNTMVEIIWTSVPVLILMVISIFSFRLLFDYHNTPHVDVTVKVTGRQWNWDYEYPDLHIPAYTSSVLPEADIRNRHMPESLYRLASTAPMVVPVNRVVRILTTGEDVIHAFALPAFGSKIDAIPGRINETWFRAQRVGTYYGQCSELCGIDHAFMPIEIRVVPQAEFDAWVAAHAQHPAPAPAAAPAAPAAAAPAAGAAPPPAAPAAAAPASPPAAPAAPAAARAH